MGVFAMLKYSLCFVAYFLYYCYASELACDACLLSNTELVLDPSVMYSTSAIEELVSSLENLCNSTYTTPKEVSQCVEVATEYMYDIYRDKQSESEHTNEKIILSTKRLCGIISACASACCVTDYTPEQIHLSLTLDPTEMVVSWVTFQELENPMVSYWILSEEHTGNLTVLSSPAATSTYVSGGWLGVIYNCTLTNLEPGTVYRYRIDGEASDSPYYPREVEYHFTTDIMPSSIPLQSRSLQNNSVPFVPGSSAGVVAYFGDVGTVDNSYETAESLYRLAQNKSIQLVVQGGDLAYADGDQTEWDKFMRMNEPYTNTVATMAAVGNHENYYHFSAYNHRYFMPYEQSGSRTKQYFSFNYEKIHFISWSFERFDGVDLRPNGEQRKWLENDLQQANLERDVRPWIVLFGHRPFYCSSNSKDCTDVAEDLRLLLEDVINEYHIDVVLQAHKHNYERTYPVYQSEETQQNYENPQAPMYYVVGVGGRDKNSDFNTDQPSWSAERDTKYGYLLMSAPDENHLEMVYTSKSFNVHDSATITRTEPITNWSFSH